MIIDHKSIELFGKKIFEKVTLVPPFKTMRALNNQACFIHIIEGKYESVSETDSLEIESQESLLGICGYYLVRFKELNNSNKHQALTIHFYPDVLLKVYNDKLPDFLKNGNSTKVGMTIVDSDILIDKYISTILMYFENPSLVSEEMMILKLKEIIILLDQTKNTTVIRSILSNLFNRSNHSFREVIEAQYYTNVTLEELAFLTNKSLSAFKREFVKTYKEAPATYLRSKKLDRSLELLNLTDLKAKEIAEKCGFADVSHFSKTFKKQYQISPVKYKASRFNR